MTESTTAPAPGAPDPERWRQAAPRILEALAVNAVPLWGLFHGWSFSTLVVLYWCENLLNAVFVGGRIWLHRKLTRKRGHWEVVPSVQSTVRVNGKQVNESGPGRTTLLANFIGTDLIFTAAHGIFVAFFVYQILPGRPTPEDLRQGFVWLLAGMSLSFVLDALRIRRWSFAAIRQRADAAMGRVLVVHLALIGGMFLLAMTERPTSFFAVFIGFKLLFDLGLALPTATLAPDRVPRGLGWARELAKPGEFDAAWREAASSELRKLRTDEEVLDHAPT